MGVKAGKGSSYPIVNQQKGRVGYYNVLGTLTPFDVAR